MNKIPVKTALCSFGMSGWVFHAPFIAINKGFELYGVWERTKNLAAQKYPGIKTYRTLEAILEDEAVELVVVNTPNYTHYEYAKKALEAGKHIIVEKPFTVTVQEAEELVALAKHRRLMLSVYQNRRYDSDYKAVKKVVDEELLGKIVEVEFHYDRYKEELSPKLHKEIPGPGAGLLYDLGSHLIDQALQFFGMPDAVFADLAVMRPVSKVEDYMELLLFYKGMRARVKASYVVREALPSYILHGTKGSFIKARTDTQETQLQAGAVPGGPGWGEEPEQEKGLLHAEINGRVVREYLTSPAGNYGAYYDGVYEAIRNNQPAPVSGEDGLKVIRVIEAAYRSSREQRMVTI